MKFTNRYETLLLLMMAVIVILIYADTLTAPFILDDIGSIRDNQHIRIPNLKLKNLAWAGFKSPLTNRPIANISFALNYYLHGYNLVGYHVVNILIHISCGLFFYFLAKATIQTPALRGGYAKYEWLPFFAAFLWLVHPLQTQSVTYIVQRMNSLAAMFFVLSMLLYAKFRLNANRRAKWPLLCGFILSGILACGSKEIAATLPGFIVLYEWYFFQGSSLSWARRHLPAAAGIIILITVIGLAYIENDPLASIFNSYNGRDFTLPQRVLTQFRVVVFYISLIIWPHPSRLSLDHDFTLSYSLINPATTLASIVLILSLLLLAIVIARKQPLISFCILWFFGNLLIESSIIGLEIIFEHRNYMPSLMVIFLLVVLVFKHTKPTWLAFGILWVAGAVFAVWTYERNMVWSDEISLYRDCVQKAPGKARPYNNLGAALIKKERLAEAIEPLKSALKIKADYAQAHYNLGYALSRQGRLEAGIHHLRESLRLNPADQKALNNLGVALVLEGRFREAADKLAAALKLKPDDSDVHNNLGFALKSSGDLDTALYHFNRALELDPGNADAHNNMGLALKAKGRIQAARRHFSLALTINPNFEQARHNLESLSQD